LRSPIGKEGNIQKGEREGSLLYRYGGIVRFREGVASVIYAREGKVSVMNTREKKGKQTLINWFHFSGGRRGWF